MFSLGSLLLSGLTISQPNIRSEQAGIKLLYEYPANNSGWIENIAVRANGQLLLTSLGSPGNLHTFDPFAPDRPPVTISGFEFPDTLGIVETLPDLFYVISANFSIDTVSVSPGSHSIWFVDFRDEDAQKKSPTLGKIATVPSAKFLNGLTAFNDSTLLAADSALGVVWAIDVLSNSSWVAVDDPLMKPAHGQPFLEGINGLHFRPSSDKHRRELCFTNSQQFIFACITLDERLCPTGPAQIVGRPKAEKGFADTNWDDFSFDANGAAFIATEKGNSLQAVTPDGETFVVAGSLNSTAIASPTSSAFGRTARDYMTVYTVTAGTVAYPIYVNGKYRPAGPQIVAVQLA